MFKVVNFDKAKYMDKEIREICKCLNVKVLHINIRKIDKIFFIGKTQNIQLAMVIIEIYFICK